MGNSYSVAQEEREEAEFERLVRAVERAQRGESPAPHDLEAQYRYAEPQEGPPPSEKVTMWFKDTRGNRAATPFELVEDPSPKHPVATPEAAEGQYSPTGSSVYEKLTTAQRFRITSR